MASQPSPFPTKPLSPCIQVCRIDPMLRLCLGCGRTMDEIGRWAKLTDPQRRKVMGILPTRLRKMGPQRRAIGLDPLPDLDDTSVEKP
ncbi:MAG: DUF1289 domain-containing protein [Pseudomonadota bacterium]